MHPRPPFRKDGLPISSLNTKILKRMPKFGTLISIITGIFAAGCALYHPKPLTSKAVEAALTPPAGNVFRIMASRINHPLLHPVAIDPAMGIGPDQAAVMAVLMNPAVIAGRDRRGLAQAQLIQAGILPNPQISYNKDFVTGGDSAGAVNAFGYGVAWDFSSLISRGARRDAGRANIRSVDLDIAWDEWQAAQLARTQLYKVVALEAELNGAREADRALRDNVGILRTASEAHEKTVLDLAAAESTSQDAHATTLSLEQDLGKQRILFNKALGLPPEARPRIQSDIILPSSLAVPSEGELVAKMESRRLDLLALKEGYNSQEATVRAAILAQFPKISIGFNKASDNTNVHSTGFAVTLDLPLFDRNQGTIATESATRQKLFDEYTSRVFEGRSDIAAALSDIRALDRQIAAAQQAVPVLERLLETAQTAINQGNTDVLSFYAARTGLIQKKIQVIKLKEQLAEAQTAVEIASGCYLPGTNARKK